MAIHLENLNAESITVFQFTLSDSYTTTVLALNCYVAEYNVLRHREGNGRIYVQLSHLHFVE